MTVFRSWRYWAAVTSWLTDGSPNSYGSKSNQNAFLVLASATSKAKALLACDVTFDAIATTLESGAIYRLSFNVTPVQQPTKNWPKITGRDYTWCWVL